MLGILKHSHDDPVKLSSRDVREIDRFATILLVTVVEGCRLPQRLNGALGPNHFTGCGTAVKVVGYQPWE